MTIYTRLNDEQENKIKIRKLEMLKDHYKMMADVLSSNEVIELLNKWAGKVYNKRLETALKKINKRFYVNTRFGYYLEFCFYDMEERSFNDGNGHNVYIPYYEHIIRDLEKSSWGDGAKVIKENIAEEVLNQAKQYQEMYEKLNNQIYQINDYIKEFQEIVTRYNEFESKIDANIRVEFEMNLQTR